MPNVHALITQDTRALCQRNRVLRKSGKCRRMTMNDSKCRSSILR